MNDPISQNTVKKSFLRRVIARLSIIEKQLKTNRRWLVVILVVTIITGTLSFIADVTSLVPEHKSSVPNAAKSDFAVEPFLYENILGRPTLAVTLRYLRSEYGHWTNENIIYLLSYDGKEYTETTYSPASVMGEGMLESKTLYLKLKDYDGNEAGPWEYDFDFGQYIINLSIRDFKEGNIFGCHDHKPYNVKEVVKKVCAFSVNGSDYEGLFKKIEYSLNEDLSDSIVLDFPERDLKDRLYVEKRPYPEQLFETEPDAKRVYYRITYYNNTVTDIMSQRI